MSRVRFWNENGQAAKSASPAAPSRDNDGEREDSRAVEIVLPSGQNVTMPDCFTNTHVVSDMPYVATRNQGLKSPFPVMDYLALSKINGFQNVLNEKSFSPGAIGSIGLPFMDPGFIVEWFPGQMSVMNQRVMSPKWICETQGMCLGVNGQASGTLWLIAGTCITIKYNSTPKCNHVTAMEDAIIFTLDVCGGSPKSILNSYYSGDDLPSVNSGFNFNTAARPLTNTGPIYADTFQTINVQWDWCYAPIHIVSTHSPWSGLRVVVLPPGKPVRMA